MRQVPDQTRPDGQDTLEFLRRPDSYPDQAETIKVVETHFAWIFLSRHLAYKLKKPIKFQELDCTTLEKRRANCELETTLNRRLAASVYLGVVPLARAQGRLWLEGSGEPVEWLVKMRRLASGDSLESRAQAGHIDDDALQALVARLAEFYHSTRRAPWSSAEYLEALKDRIDRCGAQLSAVLADPGNRKLVAQADRLVDAQRRFVHEQSAQLAERVAQGRIVDGHGDLRPEHIFLTPEPQIIDCLEFSPRLRLLDTAEEMAFLDLECARAGFGPLGVRLLELYCRYCVDSPGAALLGFYRSQRALVRALLSAWHVVSSMKPAEKRHWEARTAWYLHAGLAR